MGRTGGMGTRGVMKRAAAALRRGALVAFPTETFYALGADPRKPAALRRLRRAKGRQRGKPILLIAASARQAFALARRPLPPIARELARRFWPGPLTLVLRPRSARLARALGSQRGVAVRVSSEPLARRLARTLRFPVTGTSANRSGEPPARSAAELASPLRRRVAVVIGEGPGGRGITTPGGPPSTLVDLARHPPVVLRRGGVPPRRLQALLAAPARPRKSRSRRARRRR
jgi:L-threonylcarbamoyladenylate synthase